MMYADHTEWLEIEESSQVEPVMSQLVYYSGQQSATKLYISRGVRSRSGEKSGFIFDNPRAGQYINISTKMG